MAANFRLVIAAVLTACSPPPRAPAQAQCTPAPVARAPVARAPAPRAEVSVTNAWRAGLLAAVRAITLPVAADGSSYADLALGAEMPAVLARSPFPVEPGASGAGELFPERFVTARFPESEPIGSVDLLDGVVITIHAHRLFSTADTAPDRIADSAAIVDELRARFGMPNKFSVEPEQCTFWFRFPDPTDRHGARAELSIRLVGRELSLELCDREKAASLLALEQKAKLVLEQREHASACAECRRIRVGQPSERWYTIVSIDYKTCTMKIKQVNWGMRPPPEGRELGEVSEAPCSGYNGY